MSHWTNLGHVPNTKSIIVVMRRLEPIDWPISDHILTPGDQPAQMYRTVTWNVEKGWFLKYIL